MNFCLTCYRTVGVIAVYCKYKKSSHFSTLLLTFKQVVFSGYVYNTPVSLFKLIFLYYLYLRNYTLRWVLNYCFYYLKHNLVFLLFFLLTRYNAVDIFLSTDICLTTTHYYFLYTIYIII